MVFGRGRLEGVIWPSLVIWKVSFACFVGVEIVMKDLLFVVVVEGFLYSQGTFLITDGVRKVLALLAVVPGL
jgi:hypothetical protein